MSNADLLLSTVNLAVALGVVGLIVGSFLGLVSLRAPLGQTVVLGRSRCASCSMTLSAQHLVPVLSYLAQQGRCTRCDTPIPQRYPLMEIACAVIGVWAGLGQPNLIGAVLTALLGWQLLLIAVIDAEHYWLPDRLTLPLMAGGVIAAMWLPDRPLLDALLGIIVGFCGLWVLGWLYSLLRGREGLGGGDPILFGATGAWVGWGSLLHVLLIASLSGLAVVIAAQLANRTPRPHDRLPFGAFLTGAAWIVWWVG